MNHSYLSLVEFVFCRTILAFTYNHLMLIRLSSRRITAAIDSFGDGNVTEVVIRVAKKKLDLRMV